MHLLMKFTNIEADRTIIGKCRFNELLNNCSQVFFHRHVNGNRDNYIEAAFFEKHTSSVIRCIKESRQFQNLYKKMIRKPNLKGYKDGYTLSDEFLSLLDDLKFGYAFMVSASAHERTRNDSILTVDFSGAIEINTMTNSDFFEYDIPYQHTIKN